MVVLTRVLGALAALLITVVVSAGCGPATDASADPPRGGSRETSPSSSNDEPGQNRDETPADDPPSDDEPDASAPADGPSRGGTPAGVPEGAQRAVVERIVDGDTLELHALRSGRVLRSTASVDVRLLEIDTPETVHPSEPVQCFGPAASDALARLAPVGSTVWVLPDQELKDSYDRTLLYLWSVDDGDALFVNRTMVARGFARAALYEPNDRFIDVMYAAESSARSAGRGLWGHCSHFGAPLAPTEPASPPAAGGGNCDPNYSGACIPPYPPDLDCTQLSAQGFRVVGDDPHGFDADGDGIACDA